MTLLVRDLDKIGFADKIASVGRDKGTMDVRDVVTRLQQGGWT